MSQESPHNYDIKKIIALGAVVMVFLYGSYSLYKSWTMTEEDRIKAVLYTLQKAAAGRDWEPIVGALSADFQDHLGNDVNDIRRGLLYIFLQQKQSINVKYHQITIQLSPSKKKARVFVSASKIRGKIQKNTQPEIEAELQFIKQEGQWLMQKARYQGI